MMTPTGLTRSKFNGPGVLFAVFTLSGFSGLIYESIWSHYLKLFLGHAAYAQSLVLTIFMGGMAAGAYLAARMSLRLTNLLLAYAVVEAVTGLIAIGFHPLYVGSVQLLFDGVAPSSSPGTFSAIKWTIASLLILPQSVLLGATFPLISGSVIRRFPRNPGATLSMLYFTNCLGAAIGVLASGFWLIEWLGLPGTVLAAGMLNVALAALVWGLSRVQPAEAPPPPVVSSAASAPRFILWVAFLAGTASFIYEIAWIRMLSLVLGSSTHAFELMLSAFIFGLAFGGLWIRGRIDRLKTPLVALAVMFSTMATLAILTLPAYGLTFDLMSLAISAFNATDAGYSAFNAASHALAALIMIPTTFVAGMTLPVITNTLLVDTDERIIGKVYASNTVGAIVGVMLAVHVLLPLVGLKGAITVGALVQLGTAFLLLRRSPASPGITALPRGAQLVLAASIACILLVMLFVRLDPLRMASGVYRAGQARLPEGTRVTYMRDGKTASISLAQIGSQVIIATNGKPDAAINMGAGMASADEITMTLAAALPLSLHRNPADIANIGIGSGLTSHVVLGDSRVRNLDSIEIEPSVATAAKQGFGARVERLFNDPRSLIYFDDAKSFFSVTPRKYDVIISEPSNPWISGVATLFSREFYRQIRRHIADDGLLVQWIQVYETDIVIVASIIQALSSQFEDYAIFNTDDANILIVAIPKGTLPTLDARIFDEPKLAADLQRVGINSMGDIELRRIGNKRVLDPFMASFGVPANSDFRPFVDLNAPRMRFLKRDALSLVRLGHLAVPLADFFGLPLSTEPSVSPASAQYFQRHRMAADARRIVDALQANNLHAVPTSARADILLLEMPAESCGDVDRRASWLDAVHSLASQTSPFLPPSTTEPAWRRIRSAGCFGVLDPAERAWVAMQEGIARRDVAAVAEHGSTLLMQAPAQMTPNQLFEALLAAAAAQIATGHPEEAQAMLEGYLPALGGVGRYETALRLLEAQLITASDQSLAPVR